MRKLYLLITIIFLWAIAPNGSYAQDYYPGTVTIAADTNYCVGAPLVAPLTGTVNFNSCAGAFTALPMTVRWYYNTVNSNNPVTGTLVATIGFGPTAVGGAAMAIPTYTPSVAVAGPYYYFCVVSYGATICSTNISDSIVSATNLVLVGAPLFLNAALAPNPICAGDSVYFSATAAFATTYQWSGPGTSGFSVGASPPPFSVNITDAGVYTITATNACGTSFDTIRLIINLPISFASATIFPDTICSGSLVTLHDSVVGGTGNSYTWVGPVYLNASTIYTQNITFTGNTTNTGVYTLTATAAGCPPWVIATARLQVDTLPVIISDTVMPNPICSGYLITLTDSSRYGTSFLWSGPPGSGYTSTQKKPTPFPATLADAGIYTFTATNSCGSVSMSTLALTVHATPAHIMGSDTAVCLGSLIHFVDTTIGGYWGSSNTSVATVNTVGTVTGISAGTTIIYYSTALYCYDSVFVTVGIPVAPISGNESVCVGDSTQLFTTSTGGIWSSGSVTLATVNNTTGFVTGVNPGTVLISYTTPGCTPATHLLDILAAPKPILGESRICKGATVTFIDSTTGGNWSSSNTSVATVSVLPPYYALIVGVNVGPDFITYSISDGCKAVKRIQIDTLPPINIVGPDSICYGECAILYPVPHIRAVYEWKPNNGISCTICDSVRACPLETQTYTVVVTNEAHCKDSATHKLTVNPLPVLTYTPDPFFLCKYQTKQIIASGAATYFWYPNVMISDNTIFNPVFSDTIDLVYSLIGTSALGCQDSIKVPVSVLDSAFTGISPDTIICLGNHTRLIATSTDAGTKYKWYIMPGFLPATSLNNDTAFSVIATPTVTTTYVCIITENACFSATRYVTVYVDVKPDLAIVQPNTIIAGSSVTLAAVITNSDTGMIYEWTPPETVTCPSCPSTPVTPTVTTMYYVCVTTNRGCFNCDSVNVKILCDNSQIFIPNTFTPNGDGFNDRFYISGKGLGIINRITVYNRWGQSVFSANYIPANDPAYGWDGTFHGQILEPDVFMYTLEVLCETDGVVFKFHGDISLVR